MFYHRTWRPRFGIKNLIKSLNISYLNDFPHCGIFQFLPFDKFFILRYDFPNRFEQKRGNCDAKTGTGREGRAA